MNPKVSIIVPIYNVEKYLERCLDSITNQSYNNLEILLINDGSTDNSYRIIEQYAQKDKRIIIINQSNHGQAYARNRGLDRCTGDFILFVDSDDWIVEDCVDQCIDKILKTDSELVIFDIALHKKNKINYETFGVEIFNSHTGPCNKLYSKTLWRNRRFPENFWYEDLGIIPIIVGNCSKKVKINKPLYNYDFTREDSQSHKIDPNRNMDILKMVNQVLVELRTNSYSAELEYLCIIHLLNNLVIRKASLVNDKAERNSMISRTMIYMEENYPNWYRNKYYINNKSFKSLIERTLLYLLRKKKYNLLSVLWNIIVRFS